MDSTDEQVTNAVEVEAQAVEAVESKAAEVAEAKAQESKPTEAKGQESKGPEPKVQEPKAQTADVEALRQEVARLKAENALRAQGVPTHLLADLTQLLADSGQSAEEFLTARPWAKAPEPGHFAPNPPQSPSLTVEDLKHMTPAEINAQWEKLGKGTGQTKTRIKVKR
jgi:hypothetical protein